MDLVFDIVFGVAFILNTYQWFKFGWKKGYAEGIEGMLRAFKKAMEREVETDEKEIFTVDLFCGAGGASTGLEEALKRKQMKHKGLAINHWAVAVDTMKRNHPDIDAKQMSIEEAVPADLVPGRIVDLLWASPSCTHHSRAKGGKPRDNQLRSQPELVLTWLDQLFVRRVIIENVPEFVEWGPLNSEFEKLLLKTHDIAKGYRGKAPAGEMEKAWGVKKLKIKSNCVCVPVMQNK